jgi:hypothetical protein
VDFEKENKSDYPEHEKDEDSQSGQPESEKEGNDYKDIEISF